MENYAPKSHYSEGNNSSDLIRSLTEQISTEVKKTFESIEEIIHLLSFSEDEKMKDFYINQIIKRKKRIIGDTNRCVTYSNILNVEEQANNELWIFSNN